MKKFKSRRLRLYPDPILKEKSLPIQSFGDSLKILLKDMREIMYAHKGIGISAVQIGVLKRVIFIHIPELRFHRELINPEIVEHSIHTIDVSEGCLSFPGVFTKMRRYATVSIQFQDASGKPQYYKATHPLISQCIQHELEHLDGILFTDS